ncbi:Bax inhibitor-1/YccA family protein [Kineococcus terrestris]|uniref:Bax inhibitor-1/YccA family protein n=1 Tax=Kineococcus terrestris TaxID=2044856 RepID=UPI0034DB16AF
MESRNPVFANSGEWKRGGYATFDAPSSSRPARGGAPGAPADASAQTLEDWYRKPSATPEQSRRMTLDDVVVRTGMLFVVLLAGAAIGWTAQVGLLLAIGAALGAMVLGIWAQVSKKVRPGVMFAYAGLQGVFVGAISQWYTLAFGNGLVPQAVVGTLAAFGAMLLAYKTGLIRATARFRKIMTIAVIGYLIFGLVNLGVALFTGASVYGMGGIIPVLVGGLGVTLASLFLVLDFDYIEQGIRNGLPQQEAWRAGFGLMVTLVWLYLEILRLLAILRGSD